MGKRKIIIDLIFKAVEELNQQLPKKQQLTKSAHSILFGRNGKLDSLGLVNLIVALEQNIEDELELSITLADERAMSQKHSPFRTVGSLADYTAMILEEKTND